MDADDQLIDNNIAKVFTKPSFKNEKISSIETLISILKQYEKSQGKLLPYQTKMIENVLNFQYLTASNVMTHRIDILAVDEGAKVKDVLKLIEENGISRIPVYKQNIDTIIGAVFVKDLLKPLQHPNAIQQNITPYIRDLLYIPKSMKCIDLFLELTKTHTHLAVVIDDFGGTSGIVTMEDIIETIFGKIQDEYDNEVEEITKINDRTYIIQGFASLDDVSDALNLEIDEDINFDTLSGFLIDLLGHIPEQNEKPTIMYKNIEFSILTMEKHHIEKVKACKI